MKFATFFRSWEGTRRLNNMMAVALAAQSLAIAGLGLLVLRQDRTVTMVPPDFKQEVSVRRGTADPAFLESWAAYFASVLGNVTPGNTDFVRRSVEGLLCPDIYHEVVTAIERESLQMRQDRVSTRFEARRVLHERSTGRTFVQGQQVVESVTGSQARNDRTFEFRIQIRDFKPELCGLSSYAGLPRTQDVLDRENNQRPASGERASRS
ncbi:TraE/TraK family type IV conjugative transfer system protein [Pseudoroseomonas sp. WGS1072]|uniref:TraE/TraK family type IV conjugative transfer system protein n=1 Tax=Roseomonas sp. WGS1072 TaxID=3366816 RepID=UPI003BF0CCE8